MSLPKPDSHVRISESAMKELKFLAEAEDVDVSKLASRLLESALLGAGHNVRVAAKRAMLAGISGDA
jgi:hypothetical protein